MDPIAEEFPHLSVYNYASNNPTTGIDLHGLQFVPNWVLPFIEVYGKVQKSKGLILENMSSGANAIERLHNRNKTNRSGNEAEIQNVDPVLDWGAVKKTKDATIVMESTLRILGESIALPMDVSSGILQSFGDASQVAGYTLLIPTEGASGLLIIIGGGVETTGDALEAGVYIIRGEKEELMEKIVDQGVGFVIDKALPVDEEVIRKEFGNAATLQAIRESWMQAYELIKKEQQKKSTDE